MTHRELLASEHSRRFRMSNYRDKGKSFQQLDEPTHLAVCVNSLKYCNEYYDVVVLDEAGQTRRWLRSVITKHNSHEIYEELRKRLANAKHVIIAQDCLTKEDVSFFTNMCSGSDDTIGGYEFIKPVEMHPIKYTHEMPQGIVTLLNDYRVSVDNTERVCQKPLVVFVTSWSHALFIVEMLKRFAVQVGADASRIHGIWRANRFDEGFNSDFAGSPNVHAHRADVLVATTILGSGFDISAHFHGFHAFLCTGVLTTAEEKQFVNRLRLAIETLPPGANRDSFMYIERSRGTVSNYQCLLDDDSIVRKERQRMCSRSDEMAIAVLAETNARVICEKQDSAAHHVEKWVNFGNMELVSIFKEL